VHRAARAQPLPERPASTRRSPTAAFTASTRRRLCTTRRPFLLAAVAAAGPTTRALTMASYRNGPKVADGLEERYAAIKAAQPQQEQHYAAWLASGTVNCQGYEEMASALGLALDVASGTISYTDAFQAPSLPFELWYCRHGKTTGNTEPRVYQGYVDEPSNALNEVGLQQAQDAADKLEALGLDPDLVVLSPLARAADTGKAFLARKPSFPQDRVLTWESCAEMRFGDWDNMMVKDMPTDSICHLFYLGQNAVVKSSGLYVDPASGNTVPGENFVEVLHRTRAMLTTLTATVDGLPPRSDGKPKQVIIYGHSMAGAALSVLTGNGKQVDGKAYLGFDGKYIMPNATPVKLVDAA
jgi:broad specificity phosphatase PhoE